MVTRRRIPTVEFLRTLAREAGDTGTARGQALHRAAAHVVKMHEEMARSATVARQQSIAWAIEMIRRAPSVEEGVLVDRAALLRSMSQYMSRLESHRVALAEGLYRAVSRQMQEQRPGSPELQSWEHLAEDNLTRRHFLELADIALGEPEYDEPV